MMDSLYNLVCNECSEKITKRYSTSFSMGIMLFDKNIRTPIYNVYGFVRFADEIVDTYSGEDKASLLNDFRNQTFEAIEKKVSLNPVLHAFQDVVNTYQIDLKLIIAFLDSMAMDLEEKTYDNFLLDKYVYGSAEVVGLMCLKIFVNKDLNRYNELTPYARALGSAFQKVNFLRDLKSDFDERGRIYFPNINFGNFTKEDKVEIEKNISEEFENALVGIKLLPTNCRFGVYSAYKYYLRLFEKIKSSPAEKIKERRLRVTNPEKIYVLTKSWVRMGLGIL